MGSTNNTNNFPNNITNFAGWTQEIKKYRTANKEKQLAKAKKEAEKARKNLIRARKKAENGNATSKQALVNAQQKYEKEKLNLAEALAAKNKEINRYANQTLKSKGETVNAKRALAQSVSEKKILENRVSKQNLNIKQATAKVEAAQAAVEQGTANKAELIALKNSRLKLMKELGEQKALLEQQTKNAAERNVRNQTVIEARKILNAKIQSLQATINNSRAKNQQKLNAASRGMAMRPRGQQHSIKPSHIQPPPPHTRSVKEGTPPTPPTPEQIARSLLKQSSAYKCNDNPKEALKSLRPLFEVYQNVNGPTRDKITLRMAGMVNCIRDHHTNLTIKGYAKTIMNNKEVKKGELGNKKLMSQMLNYNIPENLSIKKTKNIQNN